MVKVVVPEVDVVVSVVVPLVVVVVAVERSVVV